LQFNVSIASEGELKITDLLKSASSLKKLNQFESGLKPVYSASANITNVSIIATALLLPTT